MTDYLLARREERQVHREWQHLIEQAQRQAEVERG